MYHKRRKAFAYEIVRSSDNQIIGSIGNEFHASSTVRMLEHEVKPLLARIAELEAELKALKEKAA